MDLMDTATGKTFRKCNRANSDNRSNFDNLFFYGKSQMQFTPDGKSLIFSGWAGITRYDIATGKSLWSIAGQDNGAFAISSDGKRVAFQPMVYVKECPFAFGKR